MAASRPVAPPLSEFECHICTEILVEPVTLPCGHTLCKPCLWSIVEKASLHCPFCRFRIGGWALLGTHRNTLVNQELWETVQRYYPAECRSRQAALAQDAGAAGNRHLQVVPEPHDLWQQLQLSSSDDEEEAAGPSADDAMHAIHAIEAIHASDASDAGEGSGEGSLGGPESPEDEEATNLER